MVKKPKLQNDFFVLFIPLWHLIHFGWHLWEVTGRKYRQLQVAVCKIYIFVSYMHISQSLQNSSLHLPGSFEDCTSTEGERDGVRKAQFVGELHPKTQVKGCLWNHVWMRHLGAVLEHVRILLSSVLTHSGNLNILWLFAGCTGILSKFQCRWLYFYFSVQRPINLPPLGEDGTLVGDFWAGAGGSLVVPVRLVLLDLSEHFNIAGKALVVVGDHQLAFLLLVAWGLGKSLEDLNTLQRHEFLVHSCSSGSCDGQSLE